MSLFNVNSYNIDVAKILGPLSSIYVSFIDKLLTKNEKVLLSKNQIYNYTGIDFNKQDEVEKNLTYCGIMDIKEARGNSDKRSYFINYDRLNIILNNPEKINEVYTLSTVKQKPKEKVSRETKKEQTLKRLKNSVKIEDEVLRQHIFDWIDSVIEKGGYLTTQSVKINVEELSKFTSSQSIAIEVLNIATKNCWRDLSWAMNKVDTGLDNKNNFVDYSSIVSNGDNKINEAF